MQAIQPKRFGHYVLTAKLGRGGMADVFRARREGAAGFERTVVVKCILSAHTEDPAFVDMFINEAKIAAQLTHPNIVQVYELGENDGEFFIVMEYVKGQDLLRLLRQLAQRKPDAPQVPPQVAAYIARETCRALAHAHDHKDESDTARPIVHRDVSPQNIMLSYDGVVKLVDFGIAKALDSVGEQTRTGALKGKFAYMAPEQVGGQSPGPQCDIFATGVVLHEMLTGRRLFKGQTDLETLQKVQTMEVPRPSRLVGGVSPELDAIVLQALERDRDQRYQRAANMARDLDLYLQSARFAVEDMAEFMARSFPVSERDELSEERAGGGSRSSASAGARARAAAASAAQSAPAASPSSSGRRAPAAATAAPPHEMTQPSVPHARVPGAPAAAAGGGRRSLYVAGIALVVSVIGVLCYPLFHERAPHTPRVEPAPLEERGVTPPASASAPAPASVRLASEPPGAQVYDGPKLLGSAPLDVRLGADGTLAVTLAHPGYDDLSYTVRAGDAPQLTLRLMRRHDTPPLGAHHVPTAKPAAPPRKGKIETLDDGNGKNVRAPKVEAIDD